MAGHDETATAAGESLLPLIAALEVLEDRPGAAPAGACELVATALRKALVTCDGLIGDQEHQATALERVVALELRLSARLALRGGAAA